MQLGRTKMKIQRTPKKRMEQKTGQLVEVRHYDSELFLQPWFVPKAVLFQMRKMLPSCHLLKLRYYFEDYGCLRCGKSQVLYGANGFCKQCSIVVRYRILLALKRRFRKLGTRVEHQPIEGYLAALE
jgi:hypothetical protein